MRSSAKNEPFRVISRSCCIARRTPNPPPGWRIRNETAEDALGKDEQICDEQLTGILPSIPDYSPFEGTSSCTHLLKAAGLPANPLLCTTSLQP